MKKFSFILGVALCACTVAIAQTQLTAFNPYAYGVEPQVTGNNVSIQYQLNSAADSTKIVIYCNEVEVGSQTASDNAEGTHTVTIDLSPYKEGGTYTFGIRVYGTSVSEPTQIMVAEGIDTTALHYSFIHPIGVAIDNNPFSPNFGRLLVSECREPNNSWYHSYGYGRGIYAFDPTFSPIMNGTDKVFNGGITFNTNCSPYRIRISDDSRIFVSDERENLETSLYELSADLQTWTPIFEGSFTDGLMHTADGQYMTGRNAGLDVVGEGDDLEIIMLNFKTSSIKAGNGTGFYITTYELGSTSSWNSVPSSVVELSTTNDASHTIYPVAENCGIASDGEGGFWYKSGRSNVCEQRGFCHITAEGVVDWELQATAADTSAYNIVPKGANGGAGIARVGNLLFVGMGQVRKTTGHLQVFEIDATGSAPALTLKYDMMLWSTDNNLNDFAVDYANNLYTIGNLGEVIVPIVLPYDGVVETPVNASVVKESTAVENVENAPAVTKIIRNGQVIIIKDGIEYNALGTRL